MSFKTGWPKWHRKEKQKKARMRFIAVRSLGTSKNGIYYSDSDWFYYNVMVAADRMMQWKEATKYYGC